MNSNSRDKTLRLFERHSQYIEESTRRGIDEYRKGYFSIKLTEQGDKSKKLKDVHVSIKQIRHDFKFGCSIFHLDEFQDDRDKIYRSKFKNVFNYSIMPLYWGTLEPEREKYRFEKDCPRSYRRPSLDLIAEYCKENNIKIKGHPLMYHSFNPDWMPQNQRELKIAVDERLKAISERYGKLLDDVDVINEMVGTYKNRYEGLRNFPIVDEREHFKWCFEIAKKYFPFSKLHINEGCKQCFSDYTGDKTPYYLLIKDSLERNIPIESIGMQFHTFCNRGDEERWVDGPYNPMRLYDIFDMYGRFNLPIHISEISVPSLSNEAYDEEIQAELVKYLYKIWFSRKNIEAIVWWNLVDNTAYDKGENSCHAGLMRNDMSDKPAYSAIEHLINKEWHTELDMVSDENGEVRFNGFYGDYEICVSYGGKENKYEIHCEKENSGYDGVSFDMRSHVLEVY